MSTFPSIAQLVRNELPAGFVVYDDYITLNTTIQQELLYVQAGISEGNKNTEAEWPNDWNLLISYLIVFGILQTALMGGILINSGSSGDGAVKKIVTGPSEVEWQDTAAAFSTLLKNLSVGPDSIFNVLISNACSLSRILGIKIPFCKGAQFTMFRKAGVCWPYDKFLDVITREAILSNQTNLI